MATMIVLEAMEYKACCIMCNERHFIKKEDNKRIKNVVVYTCGACKHGWSVTVLIESDQPSLFAEPRRIQLGSK